IDNTGHAHLAYITGTTLRYASNLAGGWAFENVGSGTQTPPSITIDDHGDPHIAYKVESTGEWKHTTRANGNWSTDTIGVGAYTADLVFSNGVLHAVYASQSGVIKHATLG